MADMTMLVAVVDDTDIYLAADGYAKGSDEGSEPMQRAIQTFRLGPGAALAAAGSTALLRRLLVDVIECSGDMSLGAIASHCENLRGAVLSLNIARARIEAAIPRVLAHANQLPERDRAVALILAGVDDYGPAVIAWRPEQDYRAHEDREVPTVAAFLPESVAPWALEPARATLLDDSASMQWRIQFTFEICADLDAVCGKDSMNSHVYLRTLERRFRGRWL